MAIDDHFVQTVCIKENFQKVFSTIVVVCNCDKVDFSAFLSSFAKDVKGVSPIKASCWCWCGCGIKPTSKERHNTKIFSSAFSYFR